jgi:hypothetical protein
VFAANWIVTVLLFPVYIQQVLGYEPDGEPHFAAWPIFTVALVVEANAEIVLKMGYDHTPFPLHNLHYSYILMLYNLSS